MLDESSIRRRKIFEKFFRETTFFLPTIVVFLGILTMYIKDRARIHGLVIIETNKIFTLYVIISGHANITIIIAKTCPRIVVIQTYQKLLFAARCPMTRKIFA